MNKLSTEVSKPEVIMPVATESFKDSQAAACRDHFFHPSSPEEKAVGRICTWTAGILSGAENAVE